MKAILISAVSATFVDLPMSQNTDQVFKQLLRQSKSGYKDQTMTLEEGFSHVVEFKIGSKRPIDVKLIPDTRLSEITVMS